MQVPPAQATAHPAKGDLREETGGATSTGPAPPRGRKRKDTVLDTRPPRARDGGVASEALSLRSQDARTTKGRQDQNGEPTATRTVPSKPRAKAATTARTPVPESQAEALTTPGAGSVKGGASAVMPRRETPRAKPPSTPLQARTTQRSRSLRAANFKSEPRWDFEEQYSFDVGALQTVSPPPGSLL